MLQTATYIKASQKNIPDRNMFLMFGLVVHLQVCKLRFEQKKEGIGGAKTD
jgi:hypothetical protein